MGHAAEDWNRLCSLARDIKNDLFFSAFFSKIKAGMPVLRMQTALQFTVAIKLYNHWDKYTIYLGLS